ncbi:MAG: endonuclease/exonuclease/phosphatase family protein, partial [Bacteroides sp.]
MKRLFLNLLIGLFVISSFAQEKVTFPELFRDGSWKKYVGKEVVFDQTLYVCGHNRYEDNMYLSSCRVVEPDELYVAGTPEYEKQRKDSIYMLMRDFHLSGQSSFVRLGTRINGLKAKIKDSLNVVVYANNDVVSYQLASRPERHAAIGNYTLKVCGFNIENYSPNWQNSLGPHSQEQFEQQQTKIVKALSNIDADIFALCELQEDPQTGVALAEAINKVMGATIYTYLYDGNYSSTKYTKIGFLYKSSKVSPYGGLGTFATGVYAKRQYTQGFQEVATGEKFVLSLNHFQSKASKAPDKGNSIRLRNAQQLVDYLNQNLNAQYNDPDVLILGDLNAYAMEEPIRYLYNNGFINEYNKWEPGGYSYSYKSRVGHLDHALASKSMDTQITGVTVFHINTDENTIAGYQNGIDNTMYRCSDHDPVVVGLKLGKAGSAI